MFSRCKSWIQALVVVGIAVGLLLFGGWATYDAGLLDSEATANPLQPVQGGFKGEIEWIIKPKSFNCFKTACEEDCCRVE